MCRRAGGQEGRWAGGQVGVRATGREGEAKPNLYRTGRNNGLLFSTLTLRLGGWHGMRAKLGGWHGMRARLGGIME